MLQHGQLIGIIAYFVQHALNEKRRNVRATHADRLFNRVALLITRQPRYQVFAIIDSFGEPGNLRTIAEIVGPHRNGHVDLAFLLLARRQQKIHKRRRRFLRPDALLAKTETVPRIDQQRPEDLSFRPVLPIALSLPSVRIDCAQAWRANAARYGIFGIVKVGLEHRSDDVLDWAAAWAQDDDFPR